MKAFTLIILSMLLLFLFGGCMKEDGSELLSDTQEVSAVQKISAEQAKKIMDEQTDYIILDVRTAAEFAEGYIKGAVLIPDNEIASKVEAILPDKEKLILIYCRSGRRSALAAKEMVALGYTNVMDFGGIIDWPYETVK